MGRHSPECCIENFKHVDEIVGKHKANAKYYDDKLKNVPGLTLLERNPDIESAFWIYSILVDRKNDFMRYMKECGIAVSQVHERNDIHTCVKEYRSLLPNLDKTIGRVISIPIGWWLTDEDKKSIERIAKNEIKDFMNSTQIHKMVIKTIQDELGTKKIDDKIIDLSTKVVVELFKTLWQRKSFWESALKNVSK